MKTLSLKKIIKNRNVNNEIYDIDIKMYFGFHLTEDQRKEIKEVLSELCQKSQI